jgi:UDP-glucose 4-epimerase
MTTINRNIFITGVSGFLGRYIARFFDSQGFYVYGVESSPPENSPAPYLKGYSSIRLPNDKRLYRPRDGDERLSAGKWD